MDNDRIDLDNPLGLNGEPVTKDERIHASNDPDEVRRRRARALGQDEPEVTNGLGATQTGDGVTGSDLGYGGETGIKPEPQEP